MRYICIDQKRPQESARMQNQASQQEERGVRSTGRTVVVSSKKGRRSLVVELEYLVGKVTLIAEFASVNFGVKEGKKIIN